MKNLSLPIDPRFGSPPNPPSCHTPGPWLDCGHGHLAHPVTGSPVVTRVIEAEGFGRIAEVYDYSNEPEANFRLILAAPELLVALKNCLDELTDLAENGVDQEGKKVTVFLDLLTLTVARQVIAKATSHGTVKAGEHSVSSLHV